MNRRRGRGRRGSTQFMPQVQPLLGMEQQIRQQQLNWAAEGHEEQGDDGLWYDEGIAQNFIQGSKPWQPGFQRGHESYIEVDQLHGGNGEPVYDQEALQEEEGDEYPEVIVLPKPTDRPRECVVCDRFVPQPACHANARHLPWFVNPVSACGICCLQFNNMYRLKEHKATAHPEEDTRVLPKHWAICMDELFKLIATGLEIDSRAIPEFVRENGLSNKVQGSFTEEDQRYFEEPFLKGPSSINTINPVSLRDCSHWQIIARLIAITGDMDIYLIRSSNPEDGYIFCPDDWQPSQAGPGMPEWRGVDGQHGQGKNSAQKPKKKKKDKKKKNVAEQGDASEEEPEVNQTFGVGDLLAKMQGNCEFQTVADSTDPSNMPKKDFSAAMRPALNKNIANQPTGNETDRELTQPPAATKPGVKRPRTNLPGQSVGAGNNKQEPPQKVVRELPRPPVPGPLLLAGIPQRPQFRPQHPTIPQQESYIRGASSGIPPRLRLTRPTFGQPRRGGTSATDDFRMWAEQQDSRRFAAAFGTVVGKREPPSFMRQEFSIGLEESNAPDPSQPATAATDDATGTSPAYFSQIQQEWPRSKLATRPINPGPQPGGPRPARQQPGGPRPALQRPGGPRPALQRPGGPRPALQRPGGPRPALQRPGGPRPALQVPEWPTGPAMQQPVGPRSALPHGPGAPQQRPGGPGPAMQPPLTIIEQVNKSPAKGSSKSSVREQPGTTNHAAVEMEISPESSQNGENGDNSTDEDGSPELEQLLQEKLKKLTQEMAVLSEAVLHLNKKKKNKN